MVVVDRYSGWPIVQQSRDGFSGLVKCLREIFVTYGIAWSRRARGQDLQAHAHGQHWPERRDQPRQSSKRHASIPQHP